MDSVVEQLSEIEKTAEDIVEYAEKQKTEIEHQIQNERDVFDRETEQAIQEELSRIQYAGKRKNGCSYGGAEGEEPEASGRTAKRI